MSGGFTSLAVLEGRWNLDRVIRHSDGQEDRFDGTATFTRSGPRLIHDEEGTLTPGRGGPALKAARRYIWTNASGRFDIAFYDMRPFHSLPKGVATYETTYLCDPDRYHVTYDLTRFPHWTMTWDVEGPKKGYRMISTFVRARD
jgi:hypothetical protein